MAFAAKSLSTVSQWWAVPAAVLVFFIADFGLALAYLLNFAIGQPAEKLTLILDLEGEANLPTWYASTKLFIVAALLGLFARQHFEPSQLRSWPLVGLALAFLAFSADETAQIHEWVGYKVDTVVLEGGTRAGTLFDHTGLWMFLVGLPVAAAIGVLIWSVRFYLGRAPGVVSKYVAGCGVLMLGAVGLEMLRNFVAPGTGAHVVQVCAEELLEMAGVTLILWGTLDLLKAYRIHLSSENVELVRTSRQ
jgi:hypothetical protein